MKRLKSLSLILLSVFSALVPGLLAEDPEELRFGIISTESAVGLRQGFGPFIEDLEKKLGMKIRAFFASDYTGVIEAMRFGKVDLAWMGNKSAMEAVDRSGAEVFAQVTSADGTTAYFSHIIVHQDSPYQSIDDIMRDAKKLNFGNGDPQSTSGYLIPQYYLWGPMGVDPRTVFKRTRNANHEVNALAVANKQLDFATNNSEAISRLRLRHPKAAGKLRVIWKSPGIPRDPMVYRRDLSEDLKARISGVFLSYGRTGPNVKNETEILAKISDGWGTFLRADNDLLIEIREIEFEKDRQILANDERISSADRAEKLNDLDAAVNDLVIYKKVHEQWNAPVKGR